MTQFTYTVNATVWSSGGTGKPWQGEVTLPMRADSHAGLEALQESVRIQAGVWLRHKHNLVPSGRIDLREWGPKVRIAHKR